MVLEEAELKDERELEYILKSDTQQIEKGLKLIGGQIKTPKGILDLLCIDSDNTLTIMELKVAPDENQLQQAINYFDWVLENIYWVKDAYKLEIADRIPRIILIAPDFTDNVITEAKYLNEYTPITLLTYKCVRVGDKKEIVCNEVQIPKISEIEEKPKEIKDHYQFITNLNVRDVLKKTQETVSNWSSEITPHPKKYAIVMKFKGRNFCSFYPRRESFTIEWKEEDRWYYEAGIKKIEQAEKIINENIRNAFSLVGGKAI